MRRVDCRAFLVGCPRSGTTLLQSFLAAHPTIQTWPETNIIAKVRWNREPFRSFGLVHRRARRQARQVLVDSRLDRHAEQLPTAGVTVRQYARAMARIFDADALLHQKTVWIEKSPSHLKSIPLWEEVVPEVRLVHIVRDGRDVIASLRRAAERFGGTWSRYLDLDACIEEWVGAVEVARRHAGHPRHHFVLYGGLVENPEARLREVCRFLGVEYLDEMITGRAQAVADVVMNREPWKNAVSDEVSRRSGAFDRQFTDAERRHVLSVIEERVDSPDPAVALNMTPSTPVPMAAVGR